MMQLTSEPGDKVVFANPTAGYEGDQVLAKKYLRENEEYTLSNIDVQNWITFVTFAEVPGVEFNSVLFENVKPRPRMLGKY